MSYVAITEDEDNDINWIESQFGDNVGEEIGFFDKFLRLKSPQVEAPPTREEQDIAALEAEFETEEEEEF